MTASTPTVLATVLRARTDWRIAGALEPGAEHDSLGRLLDVLLPATDRQWSGGEWVLAGGHIWERRRNVVAGRARAWLCRSGPGEMSDEQMAGQTVVLVAAPADIAPRGDSEDAD